MILVSDPICVIDEKGWCERHGRHHWPGTEGRRRALADTDKGAAYRRMQDKFANGEALDPIRVPQKFQLHVGAHGPDTRSVWPLGYGPGTELSKLLKAIGVNGWAGCQCAAKVEQMDRWGVDGCRKSRAVIVKWLQEASAKIAGIAEKDVGDWGPMVDEAIRLADEKVKAGEVPPPPPTLAESIKATGVTGTTVSLE